MIFLLLSNNILLEKGEGSRGRKGENLGVCRRGRERNKEEEKTTTDSQLQLKLCRNKTDLKEMLMMHQLDPDTCFRRIILKS